MDIINWIILGLLAVIFLTILYFLYLYRKTNTEQETDEKIEKELQEIKNSIKTGINQNTQVNKTLDAHLETTRRQMEKNTDRLMDITKELTKVESTGKRLTDFAGQLNNLEKTLSNPKQRGVLGEYYLESVLKNVLPPNQFELQYEFKNGEKVDAIIHLDKGKILPIDSKFSLENYNRMVAANDSTTKKNYEKLFHSNLKDRIQETSKYIRADEKTMDFAFMFIPSESLYYDLLTKVIGGAEENLLDFAHRHKVIVVSPTSLLAYLQTVLQGLRSLKIEEKAKDIIKNVQKLNKDLNSYTKGVSKMGKHLQSAVNQYNDSQKRLGHIDKDVLKITGDSNKYTPDQVDGVLQTEDE